MKDTHLFSYRYNGRECEIEIKVNDAILVGMTDMNADEFMKDPLLEHIAPLPKGSVVTVNSWEVIE